MDPGTIWIGIGAMVIVSTSTAISKLKTDCGTDYKVDKVGCFWFICVTKVDKV